MIRRTSSLFWSLSCAAALLPAGCVNVVTDASTTTNTSTQTNINQTVVSGGSASGKISAGGKFDIDDVIKRMGRRKMLCGTSDDAGVWVVYRVDVSDSGEEKKNNQQLLAIAEIRAKRAIGEWMKSTVSKNSSIKSSMKSDADGVESSMVYSSLTKVNSEAFLRGVTFHSFVKGENGLGAVFYATGKIADRSAELEAQLKAAPPGVVRSIGFGVIVSGRISAAKSQAIQAALRNAVEQVMGTTVIGQSQLMDNEKAKSKVIAQTAGNVKEYRIVKEDKDGVNYQVIINARVDEKNLLDNYAAMVRSMGNPGFMIKCKDPDLKIALSDFFATLGFKVTENPAETQFDVVADCTYIPVSDDHYGKGIQIDVSLKIFDVKNGQQILFSQNNPRLTSTYSGNFHQIRQTAAKRAFKTMKKELHEKLNKVVMDWVLNGREVNVIFTNLPNSSLDETLAASINDVPCASFQTRERNGDKLVLHCSYVGPSSDFEEFLRARLKKELPQGTAVPKTEKIELNTIVFAF